LARDFTCSRTVRPRSYVILEGRDCIGGTWDLFRYLPGIRFRQRHVHDGLFVQGPWTEPKAIADGPQISELRPRETAAENGIDKKIRFHHRVKRAVSWSTASGAPGPWRPKRISGEGLTEIVRFNLQFPVHVLRLLPITRMVTTRRNSRAAKTSPAPSCIRRNGPRIWITTGKRVVVIGFRRADRGDAGPGGWRRPQPTSPCCRGRRPTWSRAPAQDALANKPAAQFAGKTSPTIWSDGANVLLGMYFFQLSRRKPARVKQLILGGVRMALGPDYGHPRPISPRITIPGISGFAWCPTATCSARSGKKHASVVTPRKSITFTPARHPG